MTLRPWLEVATPRSDIADGSFDESLFAADLGLVARGSGPADHRDPDPLCEKTYLTKNLEAVLVELGRRLAGDPAAAGVYRLQTEFGARLSTLGPHAVAPLAALGPDGLTKDRAQTLGCGATGIPEVQLVMAAPRPEVGFGDARVQPLDRRVLLRVGPDVQHLGSSGPSATRIGRRRGSRRDRSRRPRATSVPRAAPPSHGRLAA